ncbi:MAG: bacillithiol biosynthesis cysteine-adding enzyme BshC [Candidatus Hatepunaea meridiana]|nr:bacillithiol biosynthesis cysteine-adding enzyme BshC [Candidatus Hatepunaea meridiana]
MAEAIDLGRIPGIPQILLEFLSGRADVVALLGGDWREEDTLKAVGDRRANFKRPASLGDAIRKGYGSIPVSPEVKRNLEALNDPDTLAVVTGQQVGIFGGPLYTFYKALTTILLSRRLEKETSRKVIPIFWMETADADFREINSIGLPFKVDDPGNLVYTPQDVVIGRSVNFHKLTDEIDRVRSSIISCLTKQPYCKEIKPLIEESYQAGRLITNAFMDLMTGLLGEFGLVIINPLHPSIVECCVEFWELCLSRPDKLNKSFSISSRELTEMQFPLQVQLLNDALPVMHIDDQGLRRRIRGQSNNWEIAHLDLQFNDNGLLSLAREKPESLSPSALLRPVMQDWLLPTWIYVAGPSEIAYHAQIGRCYDMLNIPRPLIAPRISLTIVEPTAERFLKKNNWTVTDVIGGREILLRSSGRTGELSELFDHGAEQLESWRMRVMRVADEAKINIASEIDMSGRKMKYQWEKLKHLTINRITERDRVRVNHADRLLEMIMPDGMLQERHNNILYYLTAYGHEFIQIIDDASNLFNPQHLVVKLRK